ncbi:MAG: CUAEP/CCAEP-tail radical SAM protein [Chloroflexota bacterium]
MPTFKTLLISSYELGRQPFGLASPVAWLKQAGSHVDCLDLAVDRFDPNLVKAADLVAFYLPMHMATRMMVPIIEQVQQLNPQAHLCGYGLYAPVNAPYLQELGVQTILGGEFEAGLLSLVERLQTTQTIPDIQPEPLISIDRQTFLVPDRSDLPQLPQYAQLILADGAEVPVGYTETTRGCKHLCRHCPIVPVYNGRFRVIQPEVVLADVRQQVAAGARHITFGDPDFFNGPGHVIPLIQALHAEFPQLTYDVVIKVEHLLKQADKLPILKETGCLFITTAVESFDESILTIFEKHHTAADLEAALALCRQHNLLMIPTFVAFTPWTTLAGYQHFLAEIARLGLVEQVAPIQYSIRLLIPPGSRLLELPAVQSIIGPLDSAKLSYQWQNPDPAVEQLQQDLERLIHRGMHQNLPRADIFQQIWTRAYQETPTETAQLLQEAISATSPIGVPYMSEPWYC